MQKYNHQEVEKKWKKNWEKSEIYKTKETEGKPKYYVLDMFPYPSGAGLHVGHPKGYIATDIVARMKMMQGFNVLHPMGWDAFGLPAENYALKNKVHPSDGTAKNVATFKKQLGLLGFTYDWDREVNTTDPKYYKWTQWIFLQMFKKGLAFESFAPINWCPDCKTGLANEDLEGGLCERCGSEIERKPMRQWVLRITDYAEKLLAGLDTLTAWPEHIKKMQSDWIGKSEGAEISFNVLFDVNSKNKTPNFLILHGRNGSPDTYTFPWLKSQLESKGYKVQAPLLPNTSEPNDDEQTNFVLKNCYFDENTVIIGHSFGGIVSLRLLERGIKVNKVVLLCTPFSGEFLDKKERLSVTQACKKGFDFEKIKQGALNFGLLYDTTDYVVPMSDGEAFSKLLNEPLVKIKGKEPHLSGVQELEVLSAILPSIKVFTTRPDTLFGATYMVVAPEHPLIKEKLEKISNRKEVEEYLEKAKSKSDLERTELQKEKTGVELKGLKGVNPVNGVELPIFVADYVLYGYGTGAIMAVPAHDQRDYDFAKKHGIAIVGVVSPTYFEGHVSVSANPMEHLKKLISDISSGELCYEGDGLLMSSGKYTGIGSEEARTKIVEELKSKGLGRLIKQYRLHDWILSRQRYWGVPIPIIKCTECGYVPVPEKDLPIKLPKLDDFKPSDDGRSPLAKSGKWLKAKCPKCGGEAERETDTMDTFVDSSWYFMRYADPNNKGEFASQENMDAWLPVPLYVGGAEHNTMHLLYSRFFTKALHSLGYVKFDEPFLGRVNHGIILGPDGQKMSKSRGNVVDPDVEVKNYGADTVRMYLSFMGPYEQGGPWDPKGINGVSRFLNRIWNFVSRHEDKKLKVYEKPEIDVEIARAIKNVGGDIKELKFNTGVSGLMKMLNSLEEITGEEYKLSKEQYELILKVVAPYAPHIAEELWQEVLGNEKSIHLESWPKFDETLLKEESFNLVIQINGKVRDAILMKAGLPEDEVKKLVMANEKIQKYIDGQVIKKFIYIQGRVANIVI